MRVSVELKERGIDLAGVYRKLPIALCIVGRDGTLLAVNDLHAKLAGRSIDNLIGVRVAELHPEGGDNVARDFRLFEANQKVPNHEIEIRGRYYLVSVAPVYDVDEKLAAISVAHFDITHKKLAERKIQRMNHRLEILSTTDHLTKMLNRREFDRCLSRECEALAKCGKQFSLILFDIDNFKAYNDLYGHQTGDRCLQTVALAARRTLRKYDAVLYRFGGEEFAVLSANPDPSIAEKLAYRVCDVVRDLAIEHKASKSGVVTVSCGVANSLHLPRPLASKFGQRMIEVADHFLYDAKRKGRDTVSAFEPIGALASPYGAPHEKWLPGG